MAANDSVASMVASIERESRKTKTSADLSRFIRIILADATGDDLEAYDAGELARLLAESFAFLSHRQPGRPKIRPANQTGALAHLSVIEIVNDDMPFLVDSTLGLLNERGLDIRLMLHPVLNVCRNAEGTLTRVEDKPSTATMRESFIHVHVARLTDAELAKLTTALAQVFADVRIAVLDWHAMRARLKEAIDAYHADPPLIAVDELTEAIAFLTWLADNHFTFLGMREYRFAGGAATGKLAPVEHSGLGLLRKPQTHVLKRGDELVAMTPEIRRFFMQPAPLIITKADVRATVHRRAAMDYIGVKLFDAQGELTGELSIVGLFTSSAYTQNPADIPLLRRKLRAVIAASGLNPAGHSGKALINILENYPRDELFQIDAETLGHIAQGILKLEDRPRTRLFVRRDRFDRFVSALVFIPRDRFNSEVRQRIGELIATAFDGRVAAFQPDFGESSLVRVHYIILRHAGKDPKPNVDELEQAVVRAVRTWDDRLLSELTSAGGSLAAAGGRWRGAFPAGYRDRVEPGQSLKDIQALEALPRDGSIAVSFLQAGAAGDQALLRLYHHGPAIPLSSRLPILENMGFVAIEETTFDVKPEGRTAVIHDVLLSTSDGAAIDVEKSGAVLADTFLAVWKGAAENDAFNALTLRAGIAWRDAAVLRAFARYLRQATATYSADYMAQTLVKHAHLALRIVRLFHTRFDPRIHDEKAAAALSENIEQALSDVPVLDEDRIIRSYLNLVGAILRTTFFRHDPSAAPFQPISFKIDSRAVEGLPQPRPLAEIFVYAPDFEGIHLRFGRIARGGIRWSDRPEDYRTEILGLAKAQNVKNVVIVPVGAKGGFVPKRLPAQATREAVQAEGLRVYKLFVSSLLELTDNLKKGRIVPPDRVLRRDGDDPYLVVAADKGTATFSDIANGISTSHGFWLDDAFASGGSAGYDHKKMGITARGAWEAVKRHFREMDIDIQSVPFSMIGIGDMSGDVFGNGMLMSPQIRLVAAFDHRDIFLDPDPDPAQSFAERRRLFALPRSSWQDYDSSLISAGGGVFPRAVKSIALNEELRKFLGLQRPAATPMEVINALLRMPADLLWLGGIGTYVKSSAETNADAGDRANDTIRVNANELRVKVVGEGANLGFTQRGRIEYARAGGRINTDAIDNSAGVNSSDLEVNIKIALSAAEAAGKLRRDRRNELLADMTEEVAALVLRNNYLQTLSISLTRARGSEENSYAIALMHDLEERGLLDRKLEALPGDAEIITRDGRGETLTRPEQAVLLAYSKIALYDDLLHSSLPDDPFLSTVLQGYFPQRMHAQYSKEIEGHRLRREIVATVIANGLINRGGPAFVSRLHGETAASPAAIAAAFAVARFSFRLSELHLLVDQLDGRVKSETQTQLYLDLHLLVRRATQWFVRNADLAGSLAETAERYRSGIDAVAVLIDKALPQAARELLGERRSRLEQQGVPAETARRLAGLSFLTRAADVVQTAAQSGAGLEAVADALYGSAIGLGVDRLIDQAGRLIADDYYERLAINRIVDQILLAHRDIAAQIVTAAKSGSNPWAQWCQSSAARVEQAQKRIYELLADKNFGLAKLAVAQGAIADLATAAEA